MELSYPDKRYAARVAWTWLVFRYLCDATNEHIQQLLRQFTRGAQITFDKKKIKFL